MLRLKNDKFRDIIILILQVRLRNLARLKKADSEKFFGKRPRLI
ncbi:Uncharacterized protein dnm_007500 [Desulfonema magnum]|uniref:Uncharacterized protein n=1 Tax=Desulfonema magnum TaxID=45655 RepID=A0A975GKP9_9BACT|nr:Uncharacterized protein dnm_007500 [Desulfonema magnum]